MEFNFHLLSSWASSEGYPINNQGTQVPNKVIYLVIGCPANWKTHFLPTFAKKISPYI